ncbi:hypothetical protein SD70_25030 [Gordoniibacillus kamchatkensis]|uniref:DNA-binding response regulator n=1 Tax=Gordoniibacillus kamchatkensis TaxID=1590651 RepID=A0ABR5AE07_9BACL|nr:response regulator [Paenibacillus sp. VKM B-2647]KIL38637.1 hypothetical protein SD70_25030 [Paenibacillus sp. VKM B-2647]
MHAKARQATSIMIVDDEYLVRLGLRTTIDWPRYGFELVGEADDGETGLEMAVKLRPDIIVTDMSMPFLDGLGFMEQLRSRRIDSKIIVLSGYDDFQYAKGAIKYGVSDYIVKPVENVKLVAAAVKLAEEIRQERLSESLGKTKLIEDLVAVLKKIRNRKSAGVTKTVAAAIRYIESHYGEELSVSRIADSLFISPSYLMHIFKENTGQTVNDYITAYRMEKAKQLLSTQNYKIYEVCERVGISDPRYFSQLFKRHTKLTPKEYMISRYYE